MSKRLHRCFTKALSEQEPKSIIRSPTWVAARRGWLEFYEDRVVCGDWIIPFSTVKEAVVYEGWSFPFPVKVLELVVGETAFQFGLNPWCEVQSHLRRNFQTEKLRMRRSVLSVLIRFIVLGYIVYLLWQTVFSP